MFDFLAKNSLIMLLTYHNKRLKKTYVYIFLHKAQKNTKGGVLKKLNSIANL